MCAARFEPSSGTLGPNVSLQIRVHFISHTDVSIEVIKVPVEVKLERIYFVLQGEKRTNLGIKP